MKKQSFFHSLTPANRYVVGNLFFLYLIQGIYVIMIGSILPAMKVEYGLDYQAGGLLISAHSIGNMITGLAAALGPGLCPAADRHRPGRGQQLQQSNCQHPVRRQRSSPEYAPWIFRHWGGAGSSTGPAVYPCGQRGLALGSSHGHRLGRDFDDILPIHEDG